MAGTFTKTNRPTRPGTYFDFTAQAADPSFPGSTLGVVAMPFTHSWGPENSVRQFGSIDEFKALYNRGALSTYTPGLKAVQQVFQGEGLPGFPGAGLVLGYRMVGSAGAKSTLSLSNTTPATAITLTAKYKGTLGNRLFVSITTNTDSLKHEAHLFLDSTEIATKIVYTKTDIAALVAAVNTSWSDWLTAVQVITGTALALVGATALTTGNDGSTLVTGDWTAAMTAFESYNFGILAPGDLTDGTVLAAMLAWSQTLNSQGKRFMTIAGGLAAESEATAATRSGTLNDPNFINVGCGTYVDERLGSLSTAQMVPRIAGILAHRTDTQNLTFARLAGITISVGPTVSEILDSISKGVVVLAQDSDPDAPVRIEKGVTTFTTVSDPDRPYTIFRIPKYVRTMHDIETQITQFLDQSVIGRLPVNDDTRGFVLGIISNSLRTREAAGTIREGWQVTVDNNPPPTAIDEFVAVTYNIAFGRSLEQVFNTVVVS